MRTLHSSAISVLIKEELKSVEAVEGGTATLRCQLSREVPVEWRKGHALLRPSNKYRMRQEGTVAELLIHDLDPKDAGDYTCVVGNQKSTAALSVNGKKSEITGESLERFCPSLPSSSLYIPSPHLPSCPASTFFIFPLFHVAMSLLSPVAIHDQLSLCPVLDVCVCCVVFLPFLK